MTRKAEQDELVAIGRRNKPVAEAQPSTKPVSEARKEGLLKGRVHWAPGAFTPMAEEELANFDGTPVFRRQASNP